MEQPVPIRLCEGYTSFIVHFEDFLYGVDIGSCSQVQSQIILHGRAHDLLKGVRKHDEGHPDSSSLDMHTQGTSRVAQAKATLLPLKCRTQAANEKLLRWQNDC